MASAGNAAAIFSFCAEMPFQGRSVFSPKTFRARPIDVNVALVILRDADGSDHYPTVARKMTRAQKSNEAVRPNPIPSTHGTTRFNCNHAFLGCLWDIPSVPAAPVPARDPHAVPKSRLSSQTPIWISRATGQTLGARWGTARCEVMEGC